MYNNKGKGEGLLRKMFTQNRRMMANLSDIDVGMGTMMRNSNYLRKGRMQMPNNFGAHRYFRPQGTQIPAKSTGLNDQCFEFGEKGSYSTNYAQHQMNGSSKFSQGSHYKLLAQSVRHAPYQVPVQNREQQRQSDYFSDGVQLYTQRTRVSNEPKTGLRKTWRLENKMKPDSKIALVEPVKSAADIGETRISDFLSPSPWFPSTKNFQSSYEKSEPEKTLKYNTSDKLYNKQDNNRNSTSSKWNTSSNTIHNDNKVDYVNDLYPDVMEIENPLKKKWPVPPGLSQNIDSDEFYAKVCEAVLEKVLQQLCPNSYKANQKPVAKLFNTQAQPNRTFNFEKNMTNGSSSNTRTEISNFARNRPFQSKEHTDYSRNKPFQSKVPQLMGYSFYNNDYKKFAPKPLFNRSFRGKSRDVGRVMKRKISTNNREFGLR